MEKRISYQQFQSVKSVARAIDPILRRKQTLEKQLLKLKEDYEGCAVQINALEAGILSVIGYHVNDLVKKVIEAGTDGNGRPIKTTKYLPTARVSYDEQHKQYVISDEAPDTTAQEEISSEISDDSTPVEGVTTANDNEVINMF